MTYGVTSTGFVDKPIETILSEIEAAQKTALGAGFDVSAQSPAGQLNGVMTTQLRELWDVAQAVYSALDPDKAEGEALTALAALTGTIKAPAAKSQVTATLNLNAGKTVAAGAIASVAGNPSARFVTLADATNAGGAPADVSVAMEAETAGPVVANTGTLTVIETAQAGWNSITNAADATLGEDAETDEGLRLRRETELRRAGAGAAEAIKVDVESVTGVTSVTVFENTSDVVDGDGMPAHSFEVLAVGGAANDIAQAIWDGKPAGIEDHGGTSGTATDDDGGSHTVAFTRPTDAPLYLDIFVTVNTDPLQGAVYPVDGDTQIKAALAAWGQDSLAIGSDLILSQLYPVIFGIDGVLDVTKIEAGTAPAPAGTVNVVIASRSKGSIDTANVTVTTA